jgi:hypothetical protein
MQDLKSMVLGFPLTDEVFEVLNTAANKSELYQNQYLTECQWDALWVPKLSAADASWLTDNDLTADQVERVLSTERRASVLYGLFHRPMLTAAQQAHVLSRCTGTNFVRSLLKSPYFDRSNLALAARHFRGVERLEWFAAQDASTVSDDEIVQAIIEYGTDDDRVPRDIRSFGQVFTKLVTARPSVFEALFALEELPSVAVVQIAGSRLLTSKEMQEKLIGDGTNVLEFAILAFVANPVARPELVELFASSTDSRVTSAVENRKKYHSDPVTEPFDKITDKDQIDWVLRRSKPSSYRTAGRPCDLVVLAMNDALNADEANEVYKALSQAGTREVPAARLNAALDHLRTRLGLEPGPHQVETGFWDEPCDQYTSSFRGHTTWVLDASNRPWTDEAIEAAYAEIPSHSMSCFTERDLLAWNLDRRQAHVYLVYHLRNDPSKWEMVLNLSATHRGSLAKLISAAKRLAR